MKDKILVPAVIITLSLLVLFMLISVKEQSFFAKHAINLIAKTSESLKETQVEVAYLKEENSRISKQILEIQQNLKK